MTGRDDTLETRIRSALKGVVDPELGRSVVEIGLIYAIRTVEGGRVSIDMTTTTKGCPAAAFLVEAVRASAERVVRPGGVDVRLTYDPPWSPDRMAG